MKQSFSSLLLIIFSSFLFVGCQSSSYVPEASPFPTPVVQNKLLTSTSSAALLQPSPTASSSAKPSSRPSVKPTTTLLPSPSPVTSFDLNLESITLSTAPMVADPSWNGVIDAKSSGNFSLERRPGSYAITVAVRNNGLEPAMNVTYEVIVDGQSTKLVKDRIDQGTAHRERIMDLPNDDKRHEVKVNISVSMSESDPHNNSHSFSYQIK